MACGWGPLDDFRMKVVCERDQGMIRGLTPSAPTPNWGGERAGEELITSGQPFNGLCLHSKAPMQPLQADEHIEVVGGQRAWRRQKAPPSPQ